jgi:hypothetical protein
MTSLSDTHPSPWHHEPTLCLCGFACSGHFMSMDSHNMELPVAAFFHSASSFQGPSIV